MKIQQRVIQTCITVATVMCLQFPADAAVINFGGIAALDAGSDITGSGPGTQLVFLEDTVTPITISARTRAAVYDRGNGLLDFYYQVTNDSVSEHALGRFTVANFGPSVIGVFYRTDAVGGFVAGNIAPDFADRDVTGAVIGFNFPACQAAGCANPPLGKIEPGQSSHILVVRTNAISYLPGFIGVINGTAGSADGFQPLELAGEEIPEPFTALLTGTMLIGVAGLRRWGTGRRA